jgi:hypothetical protein
MIVFLKEGKIEGKTRGRPRYKYLGQVKKDTGKKKKEGIEDCSIPMLGLKYYFDNNYLETKGEELSL